jgi:hypothetical protein
VSSAAQALAHVAAHLAEADQTEVHAAPWRGVCWCRTSGAEL